MNGGGYDHRVMIRPSGELSTKSRTTRRRFQRRLIEAVEDALRSTGASFRVHDDWGRIFVETSSRAALDVLPRVFGLASLSEIEATAPAELSAIIETGERAYGQRVSGGTFAVRARRAGKHPFSSRDINYQLGAALNRNADVKLKDPDFTVGVEVREDCAYFFSSRIQGPGGLPAGVEAIEGAVRIPVLRPLAGFDKLEIIQRSREIGTYPLSEKVREHCALTERRPITDATPQAAEDAESRLDLTLLDQAVTSRRVLALRELDPSDLVMPYLYTTTIPQGAVVIDTRSRAQHEAWHYPGAERRDFWELFAERPDLDRDRIYVFYCEIGLKTAQLAEKLQRSGYDAYSFKGGVRALRSFARSSGLQPA
jgi:tRNA(Ser,Leu) C12 N-acetylase TAN1/rhodanese-related sulfurtransferase